MRVWVTRPAAEAGPWVDGLRGRGFDAAALPLIEIGPAPDPAALACAWQQLPAFRAAMFVSGNAVRGFMAARPTDAPWPAGTRAWATGDGTRRALLEAGLAPAQVDAPPADAPQFDSEALWSVVRSQVRAGDRVLRVRGGEAGAPEGTGRDWLAHALQGAGATVSSVAAYLRACPAWDLAQRDAVRARLGEGAWVFSSSQAIAHLVQLLAGTPLDVVRCVCTHPRIAEAARRAGFGVVRESRPGLSEVATTLESIG